MKKLFHIVPALLVLSATGVVLHTTGCAGTPTQKSTGEFVDDAAITTKVKTAFVGDPVVSALDVGVDTFKGNVQLTGFVESEQQKTRAAEIARGVPGVVDVINNLSVKQPATN